MKPVTVINCLVVKPGKMDEFIDVQQRFGAEMRATPNSGLIGGRMYRGTDGISAVLVSEFASVTAQEELRQREAFKRHLSHLRTLIESSSPSLYDVAYTNGDFT